MRVLKLMAVTVLPVFSQTVFTSNLDNESMTCWNTRNSSGWTAGSCGGFSGIGTWPIELAQDAIYRGAGCGTKAIRITYQTNEQEGRASIAIPNLDALYVRAYYYFDADFDFPQGLKLGKIRGPNGTFETMLQAQSERHSVLSQQGVSPNKRLGVFHNGGPFWPEVSANQVIARQGWHCIEYKVVLNTPGSSNGQVQLWYDGTSLASASNLNIRGSNSAWHITEVRIGSNYSNSLDGNPYANPAAVSKVYIDDLTVSQSQIGCN
jgi:hypothetical protein